MIQPADQYRPPDQLELTPLLGAHQLRRAHTINATDKEQAFQMAAEKHPEESLLLLNDRHLRGRARLLQKHFLHRSEGGEVAYAVKANSYRGILEIISQEDISSFDCCSRNEIYAVLNTHPFARILFNHPIKKRTDIQWAYENGVRHFTVQDRNELDKILANTSTPSELEITVRLDTPKPQSGIDLSEKYGSTVQEAREIIRMTKDHGAKPGLSIHSGSQNANPNVFAKNIKKMLEIAKQEGDIATINVGGGLPVNIFETDNFDPIIFMNIISDTLRQNIGHVLDGKQRIIIEPGRSMVAESVDSLIPIISVGERHGEKILFMDDGIFTSFSDAVIHGWKYPFKAWRKDGKLSTKKIPYRVYGRTCDSGDCLGLIELPEDIKEGDYIHVRTAGAYMDSQSSQFNGFNPPRYISYNV